MSVYRVEKTNNYTVMSNIHLRDKRLSLRAKGLLSIFLSLPENWQFTLAGLSKIVREGITALRGAVGELEACGYLERERLRNSDGQFTDIEYIIREKSKGDEPIFDEPISGEPISENPTTTQRK